MLAFQNARRTNFKTENKFQGRKQQARLDRYKSCHEIPNPIFRDLKTSMLKIASKCDSWKYKCIVIEPQSYIKERECHIFLGNKEENQQYFATLVKPSSGQIWQIH
jgi:hypothetical protein